MRIARVILDNGLRRPKDVSAAIFSLLIGARWVGARGVVDGRRGEPNGAIEDPELPMADARVSMFRWCGDGSMLGDDLFEC